jgi:DNA-directed RNA polymerase specialized sigma24 family protein
MACAFRTGPGTACSAEPLRWTPALPRTFAACVDPEHLLLGLVRERGASKGVDGSTIKRPEAWLFVVALRRWRTIRWRRRLFVPLESVREPVVTPPPGENAVLLIGELKRLSRREREVITCRYNLGLTQRETADALGIAVGTVVRPRSTRQRN